MARIGAQIEYARGVGCEFGIPGGMADRLLDPLHRFCDFRVVGAADDEVIGLGGITIPVSRANGGPQTGVIQMADAHASVSGGGWARPVAARDFLVGRHLPRSRKLHRAGEIHSGIPQDFAEPIEYSGQADLGVAVAARDGRSVALRTG